MSVIHAALLGLIQGIAEFLPISSSGHIQLYEKLFNVGVDPNALMLVTVLLHVGTLLAVLVIFWKDWLDILKNPFRSKTLLLLIVASLPALAAKVLLGDLFDQLNAGGLLGAFFIVSGILLCLAERFSIVGRHADKAEPDVTLKNALVMGGMQAVGMFTGISRSGSTIFGGVTSGLRRYTAAKFSFMMSAPAILGGLIVEGKDAIEAGAMQYLSANIVPVVIGMVVAAVCGYLAIRFMLKLINKISFYWFALYLFLLGVVVMILQVSGTTGLPPIGV